MTRPRILILASVPPPIHGQSLMVRSLVRSGWDWCDLRHVALPLSERADDVGRGGLRKTLRLLRAVLRVWTLRLQGTIDVLYYVPAPPRAVPVFRDIILLPLVRGCARRTVFHFHAGGFHGVENLFGPLPRGFLRMVYGRAACAVVTAQELQPEVTWIGPRRVAVVPNGIPDCAGAYRAERRSGRTVLYAGTLSERKGIAELLAAVKVIRNNGAECNLVLIGAFESDAFRRTVNDHMAHEPLHSSVVLCGELDGDEKWQWFAKAACLCFPSRDLEAQPLALLEAMCWSVPVITTAWRTHEAVVGDGGVTVPPGDVDALAGALQLVLDDPERRRAMGAAGRRRYEEHHTLGRHLQGMEEVFRGACMPSPDLRVLRRDRV